MKKLKGNLKFMQSLNREIIKFAKDEKGDGSPLVGLIWAAIVILAVIALTTIVDAAFSAFGTSFRTWLVTIATRVFN